MTWNPNATVTIGGDDFTGESLNGIAIHYGRPSIWEQARAGYCTVEILNTTDVDNAFEINEDVVITIEDSNGVDITVFTGKVTDISNAVVASGEVATVAVQTITAVASFAQMSRVIVGTTNYPKEYDDDRINRILTEAGVTIDVVDTPGVYELVERPANPVDAYTLSTYYAGMCFGYMYETTDGKVGYANESRRTVDVNANGYLDIDEGYINWRGINSRKSISDIVNKVILFYKNSDQVTSDDAPSIANYGLIEARIDTELHNMDEAQNIADRYVSLRSNPQTNFSSFNINLDNPNLTTAALDDLITIQMGTAIQIDNLPNPISAITYTGFVEGWDLIIDRAQALLTITSSDSTYSVVPIRWQDVDPLTEWLDLDPTAVKTTRTNYWKNPSFEDGTTGWGNSNANISVSSDTSDFYSGFKSIKGTLNVTSTATAIIPVRNSTYRIPVVNGETWTVGAYYKNVSGSRLYRSEVRTYATASSTTIVESFSAAAVTAPANWTKSQVSFTLTNANSLWMEVQLRPISTGSIGDAYLVDAVMATKEASNTYYWDGTDTDIPDSRRPELAWTGTADNSTSTAEAYFGTIPTLTWANVDSVGLP
jgi:hypothetical protein